MLVKSPTNGTAPRQYIDISANPPSHLTLMVGDAEPAKKSDPDIPAYIQAIAWPLVAFIAILVFRNQLRRFLGESKTISLSLLGQSISVSRGEAKQLLEEVVGNLWSGMSQEARETFFKILDAKGTKTVAILWPGFQRSNREEQNVIHATLGELRDRQLIRPFEGGTWQSDKHPVLTKFIESVLRIKPDAIPRPGN